jgi:flagellar motor switch protein FliN/FliY
MKTFLEAFLAVLPEVLSRELGGNAELAAVAGNPPAESEAIVFDLRVSGEFAGCLRVFADRAGVGAIFTAAGTPWEPESKEADEQWAGLLRAAAGTVAGVTDVESMSISREPPKTPLSVQEIRFGSAVARVVFSDEVRCLITPEMAKEKEDAEVRAAETQAAGSRTEEKSRISGRNFDLFLDIELEASLRFGSRELPLRDVLGLGPGDVVELDRNVSDPVDLVVGDRIVARGEVVLVNGNFGLRVTEVAEPQSRLESIRCLF